MYSKNETVANSRNSRDTIPIRPTTNLVGHSSGHAIIDITTMVETSCIEVMRAVVGRLS